MNMHTSKIHSLLDLINNTKNSKSQTKAIDFLFQLLKNIDDKNLVKELILKSNLPENEKTSLLKTFFSNEINPPKEEFKFKNLPPIKLPHEEFKKINEKKFNLPKEEFKFKKSISSMNFPHKKILLKSFRKQILKKLLIKEKLPDNKELELIISQLPKPKQIETIKEIKQILTSKASQNRSIQTLVNLKEFKNASNIKDIVILSKKFNLNLGKIIFSQYKQIENITEQFNKTNQIPVFNKITFPVSKKFKNHLQKPILQTLSDKNTILTQLIGEEKNKIKESKKEFNKNTDDKSDKNIDIQLPPNEIKHKAIEAKQTLKHFASSLKEAVENYKPPISKLTLELHPKEIGKVEVTIKQRGENLQVQISTNNQTTINFLTSQQQELKNSLVNMGFTNINMNFNSNNQQKKQNHQQKQNQYQNIQNNEDEVVIDFSYKYA